MDEPALSKEEVSSILELAELEASRWPRRPTNFTHVAYVLATAFPDKFDRHFGATGRLLLERLLAGRKSCGTLARAKRLLAGARSIDDAMRLFHEYLAFPDFLTRDVEMETVELCLVTEIEDRLVSYGHKPDTGVLDQLYVLVGALKVIDRVDAYEAMKRQLFALKR